MVQLLSIIYIYDATKISLKLKKIIPNHVKRNLNGYQIVRIIKIENISIIYSEICFSDCTLLKNHYYLIWYFFFNHSHTK